MNKALQNRIFRDIKHNFFRYLALSCLIVAGVYLIVSMVGAAETVIIQTKKIAQQNNVQDGHFCVFTPLTNNQVKSNMEEQFYIDISLETNDVLRIFKNRERIDLLVLDEGRIAQKDDEIVLEKQFSRHHQFKVNDTIVVNHQQFTIVGIGSVSDYENVLKKPSDSNASSQNFGLAFVSSSSFKQLMKDYKTEYCYSFISDDSEKLKKEIQQIKINVNEVDDVYFQEFIREKLKDKHNITNKINELNDGLSDFSDGLSTIDDKTQLMAEGLSTIKKGVSTIDSNSHSLVKGSKQVTEVLKQLDDSLRQIEDYGTTIEKVKNSSTTVLEALSLVKQSMDLTVSLKQQYELMKQGIDISSEEASKIDGISSILLEKVDKQHEEIKQNITLILSSYQQFHEGMVEFTNKLLEVNQSMKQVKETISLLRKNMEMMNDGVIEYTSGVNTINTQLGKLEEGFLNLSKASHVISNEAKKISDKSDEFQKETKTLLDEKFPLEINNVTSFMTKEENGRIFAASNDQIINKMGGLFAGIIVMILFAYVIAVFIVFSLDSDRSVIGTLLAMGVSKKELIVHYLQVPLLLSFVSGVLGVLLGFSTFGVNFQLNDCVNYFSMPPLEMMYPLYLIVYGIVLPPFIVVIVNYYVINQQLSQTVVSLVRNRTKEDGVILPQFKKLSFIARFQVKQMIKEIRSTLTVVGGLFLCLLLMFLAVNCFVLCENIKHETKNDTKYSMMYVLKYPEKNEMKEKAFLKTLKKKHLGYTLDISLLGINKDNPYFNASVVDEKNKVVISSAVSRKLNLKVNDTLILTDDIEHIDYAFTVIDIIPYATDLSVFMDIDAMRSLFHEESDFYNVLFSDSPLEIDEKRLYTKLTKEEIITASLVFTEMMLPMITTLLIASIFLFILVIFLMSKVMVDRSIMNISLLKLFGYNDKESRRLYLVGNIYLIGIATAILMPICKKIMDSVYPLLVANVACSINLLIPWYYYVLIYCGIIVVTLIIIEILYHRVKKIPANLILKHRD